MQLSEKQLARLLEQHDLVWDGPPEEWNTGIPLANGRIGANIWGDGSPLRITLDRYDCWELREQVPDPEVFNYENLRRLVEAGAERTAEWDMNRRWRVEGKPHPTRLPMPRVELDIPGADDFHARLHLLRGTARGSLETKDGQLVWSALIPEDSSLLLIDFETSGRARLPKVTCSLDHLSDEAKQTLRDWGYERPETGTADHGSHWLRLQYPAGGEYVVAWRMQKTARGGLLAVAVVSHHEAKRPLAEALRLVRDPDVAALRASHEAWWGEWWRASWLTLPDAFLENLWYVEMYKLGCSSRPGELPITLQGLWTADGVMPPWSGDYHLDMNVQESYWPVYASNHLDAGLPLYETFTECLPRWREECEQFFGFPGVWSGCAIAWDGSHVHGYHGVEYWPGNAAWLAHHYWLHWLHSRDDDFLRDHALPMMRGAMETYTNLLEPDEEGTLHIPLGYSPEWGEGSVARYGTDPACDIALIHWLGESLLAATAHLGDDDRETATDRVRWRKTLHNLADYPRGATGLQVTAEDALWESHRHHSHLMAIHPLGTLSREEPEEDALIQRSISHLIEMGTGKWTGWAFPWASLIASRAGLGNMAWDMLQRYRAFMTQNSFHLNGDRRAFGHARARYTPMTLEAGFCAAAAIMEMLLQSWGGAIRLFPTVPDHWGDAYFEDLRAEGAFLVSGQRAEGEVAWARIVSEAGEVCTLRNPWPGAEVTVRGPSGEETLTGADLRWETEGGAEYLVYPAGDEPDEGALSPAPPLRPEWQSNWFGLREVPRF
ncbi:MAG: glycosyl hydrolase family 95 catalytic domain-containing protein [Armatimonadota bacterium]